MSYELFQQGPSAYIPVLLVSLVITLIAYGAFPLIFANTRKKIITKKRYNVLCFCINLLVMALFIFINGQPSYGGPYLLWTWVFSALGIKILENRGVLEGSQLFDSSKTSTYQVSEAIDSEISGETNIKTESPPESEEKPQTCFCPKCGFELIAGSDFCSKCGTPLEFQLSSPASIENREKTAADTKIPKNKQRYCKLCGQPIDSTTKKCTGCGKQYFKAKLKPLHVVLAILILIVGYVGINYFCAVSAMNNQEFIKSQQFFDNLFVSEKIFPSKHTYVEAGVLMEEGEYLESLKSFENVDGVPVPAAITDYLKAQIYSAGQTAYRAGNMTKAEKNFNAISDYKRSNDYLLLIRCSDSRSWLARAKYNELVELLGFENTDEVIMKYEPTAQLFLNGRWEDGNTYPLSFEMYEDEDGWHTRYNIPFKDVEGYYFISNGIYSKGETESSAVKCFRFSIIDEDTISVYCYKDGSTHTLYRQ